MSSGYKRFLLLWIGEFVSSIGGGLTSFGLTVYVFNKTGSATYTSLIALLAFFPNLLLGVPAGVKQEKANKTLKVTIRKTVDSLEQQCQKMKEQLFEIKIEIKAKASEIVSEVKNKGKEALHRVSEFFGIKEKLESVRDNVHRSIGETEQTMAKLDDFGSGMREAGQKIANTFRTFADKEAVDYSDKEKKISKTELVKKPFAIKKKLYENMGQYLDSAIDKANSLAKQPEHAQEVDMAEPALLGMVAEQKFEYGAEAFEAQKPHIESAMAMASKSEMSKNGRSR